MTGNKIREKRNCFIQWMAFILYTFSVFRFIKYTSIFIWIRCAWFGITSYFSHWAVLFSSIRSAINKQHPISPHIQAVAFFFSFLKTEIIKPWDAIKRRFRVANHCCTFEHLLFQIWMRHNFRCGSEEHLSGIWWIVNNEHWTGPLRFNRINRESGIDCIEYILISSFSFIVWLN